VVVAEGNNRSRNKVKRLGVSFSQLGQTVPFHLLHSSGPYKVGARMYSSSSSSSSSSLPDSSITPSQGFQADTEPSPRTTDTASSDGFTSLRGLFGGPRKAWSPPTNADELAVTPQSKAPPSTTTRETFHHDDDPFGDPFTNLPLKRAPQKPRERSHDTVHRVLHLQHSSSLRPGPEDKMPRFQGQRQSQSTKAPKAPWNIKSDLSAASSRQPKQQQDEQTAPFSPLRTDKVEADLFPEVSLQESLPRSTQSSPINPTTTNTTTTTTTSSPSTSPTLTHLTPTGEAHMVDVGQKESTDRVAVAVGSVRFCNPEAYQLISQNLNKKGDVLGVARIAGIMAAKKCSDLIPLCHPIPITKMTVDVNAHAPGEITSEGMCKAGMVSVEARVHSHGQTGIEMEAITAVTVACLTVYDMCKAVDKAMAIHRVRVVYKAGGKSGTYLDTTLNNTGDKFIKVFRSEQDPVQDSEQKSPLRYYCY
jgi:cyclic pyranopterin phosphate synthase